MGEIFRLERPRTAMAFTGERFTSAESGQIEIEHVHRYFLARHFCRGKDVLDVASGEGYGAALISQVARSVVGVDVAADAIAHAAKHYARDNLRFLKGDGIALPLDAGSVDVVVSFETIEHLFDHDRFLGEIRRVLRPGGLLVLSTPDRDIYSPPDQPSNPHHVHELTRREFHALLDRHFPFVRSFAQRALLGSAIVADEKLPRADLPVVFEQRGEHQAESSLGLARATYLMALASDRDPGPLPESLFVFSGAIDKMFHAVRDLHTAIRREQDNAARQQEEIQTLIARSEQGFRERDLKLSNLESRLLRAENDRASLDGAATHANHSLRQTSFELEQLRERALALHRNYSVQVGRLRRRNVVQFVRSLPRQRARTRRILETLRASPLFDPHWYVAHNDDVRARGMDPYLHFVRFGADEGRDPGPEFSTNYYVLTNPDVIASDYNPLEHYELFGRAEGRKPRPDGAPEPEAAVPATVLAPEAAGPAAHRVAFVSGEPQTAGHHYRILRYAEAARAAGAEVTVQTVAEAAADPAAVEAASLVVIWRAEWNAAVDQLTAAAHRRGAKIMFDIDDLMFDPQFARVPVIDGIRSQGLDEEEVQAFYIRMQLTLNAADFASATTPFLAGQLRRWRKPTFALPNGFDAGVWRVARLAVRERHEQGTDGLLRIGYAGGSRTHQKDFAVLAGAVARVLAERPECRLVLFRRDMLSCLDLAEFPDFAALGGQVEWRQLVPVEELPRELARFDINLAPLEVGNPFCESKSELKFFEAALAGVVSVCSPTTCYAAAVRHGETGLLAETEEEWYAAITRLLDEPALRERLARSAYHDVLWPFGPERRAELMTSLLEQVLQPGRRAARAFEIEFARSRAPRPPLPKIPRSEAVLYADSGGVADVTVIVPLHNYASYIVEALDSVRAQSLETLDLVVIDDCSTDDSLAVARDWIDRNLDRFNRAILLRNSVNVGLALTRNAGFGAAETRFVLQLDADNKLMPDCAARCLEAIERSGAAFVYPTLRQFGDADDTLSDSPYQPALLSGGNYIDATALVRLSAWAAIGGYDHLEWGWEDYDVWCRFAERGMYGHHVPETLALYRVHGSSMLRTVTDVEDNRRRLIAAMRARHPWILEAAI